MAAEIVKLQPVEVGEGYRFDPDEIVNGALGKPFRKIAIIGELDDGEIWVSGNANAGETLVLMELAKRVIVPSE